MFSPKENEKKNGLTSAVSWGHMSDNLYIFLGYYSSNKRHW